jgi:glucose/arabinose dehydrogenase
VNACSSDEGPGPQGDGAGNATGTPTGTSSGGAATSGANGTTSPATTDDSTVTSSTGSVVTTTGTDGTTTTGTVTTGTGGSTSTGSTDGLASTTGVGGVGGTGGTTDWWFDGPRTPPPTGTWPPPNITLNEVSSATQPTAIAAPRADTSRLYFAEKWGIIRLIKDGQLVNEPALDIRDEVLEGGPSSNGVESPNQGKRGLVGLAFDPNYETNGRVFVMYVADQGVSGYGTNDNTNVYDDGDMTIAEYRRSESNPDIFDPASAEIIVQWDKGDCQQCSQHNGGALEIDVDGFLWASTGDPPPYDNPGSQDLNNLNGKLLRFDISGDAVTGAGNYPGADPYVSSIGIRNTYKFSIDRYTGDVYVADVGENTYEELTVERHGQFNQNHGWPIREGQHSVSGTCDECIEPAYEYVHTGAEGQVADNCIIGGYVYRGTAIPALQGTYLFSDYGSGQLRGLQVENGQLLNGGAHDFGISVFAGCFGEDAAGEMYVCDYDSGRILRVDAQ